MIAISLLMVSGLVAVFVVFPHRARRLRASRPGWRAVERERVAVNAAPMGAYRDAGTVSIPHADVPPPLRVAATLATTLAPVAALLGFSGACSIEASFSRALPALPAPAAVIAALMLGALPIAAAFLVDGAGASLLRRETAARSLAQRALVVAWASLAVTLAACLWGAILEPAALDAELMVSDVASAAALTAAALLLRANAARYHRALDLV